MKGGATAVEWVKCDEIALYQNAEDVYQKREEEFGAPMLRYLEKVIMLQSIDYHWKDHLLAIDQLKEGIGLPQGTSLKKIIFTMPFSVLTKRLVLV